MDICRWTNEPCYTDRSHYGSIPVCKACARQTMECVKLMNTLKLDTYKAFNETYQEAVVHLPYDGK